MRHPINGFLFLAMLCIFLAGCPDTAGARHDDLQAPPATAHTSAATEDLVAQKGAAAARSQVDAANIKAAQAEVSAAKTSAELAKAKADLATAQAQAVKDAADLVATKQALIDQQSAEASGRLFAYIGYAIPVGIAAAICIYEGWMTDAAILGIIAGCLIVLPMLFTWILGHGKLIGTVATIGVIAWIAYRYRAKLPVLEAKVKADLQSAESAVAHLISGGGWATAEADVKTALVKAWAKVKGVEVTAEHLAEAVFHLKSASPPPAMVYPPGPVPPKA